MKTLASTEVVESGQRRDTRGRRIIPPEEQAALIAEYEKSGLTQRAFAEREAAARVSLGSRGVRGWGGATAVF